MGTRQGGHGATSTVPARAQARERVWRAAVVQGSAWEKGNGERGPGSTALVDALARPERVWRASGAFWARRGTSRSRRCRVPLRPGLVLACPVGQGSAGRQGWHG
jgi:hypothetical protein